ncbi:MAG TPA: hypothetical protein DCS07_11315 [Bdellovibrionales bacterium]|nr:MAG: hypothetical protein A2Z97_14930 [Bdellovibrionales bacterium GWB1_52_6]OFZ05976.1 MAG: hypothetical protein A2X97_01395 [Bdellovibrionales bacterium GWA1_52_35]OFZ38443.1 MAG: hypothetical protein A2070_03260 [Bdellovibrionales bacterium GWC1_52_8]HAR43197.1 hypothetical protein [Bdellovibrionales bacterium]HCM39405.1 hypothetical protein [Bdellovibrionales bacterium]
MLRPIKELLKTWCVIFSTLFILPLCIHTAEARDLQGRLGLGYNSEFANYSRTNGIPGVSIKYGLTRDLAGELVVGMNTATPTNSVTAVKAFKNVFYETNLNFYFMLGAGLLSAESRTGFEMLGGMGAEFFIPGVESLGFSMETGGSLNNISGSFALQTIGVSFLNAGIHFYF